MQLCSCFSGVKLRKWRKILRQIERLAGREELNKKFLMGKRRFELS
jgi:hypothetical protein